MPHQAIIDQNSPEPGSYGVFHELSGYRRINSAADSTQNLAFFANKLANSCNLLVQEGSHSPVLLGTANADGEVF
jgi:hypothetical protein